MLVVTQSQLVAVRFCNERQITHVALIEELVAAIFYRHIEVVLDIPFGEVIEAVVRVLPQGVAVGSD